MTPHKHPLCNDALLAPPGMDDCGDLPIRREPPYVWSYWKPDREELMALVLGGSVALAVYGITHPPLSVNTTTPTEPVPRKLTPEESDVVKDAILGRYESLFAVAKDMATMLAKAGPDSPERRLLLDRFMDCITVNRQTGQVVRNIETPDQPTT